MNDDPVLSQVRANIAFEHMLVAMLAGAAASGTARFLLDAGAALAGGVRVAALFAALWAGISFACIAFLLGFLAIVVAGLPLFLALERVKFRKVWPYAVAAILIELIIIGVAEGGVPMLDDLAKDGRWLAFAPGVIAAFLFGRAMRPFWRAAERAETAPAIYRIH